MPTRERSGTVADHGGRKLVELLDRRTAPGRERADPNGKLVAGCSSRAHHRGGVEGEQSLGHRDGSRAVFGHYHRQDRCLRCAAPPASGPVVSPPTPPPAPPPAPPPPPPPPPPPTRRPFI